MNEDLIAAREADASSLLKARDCLKLWQSVEINGSCHMMYETFITNNLQKAEEFNTKILDFLILKRHNLDTKRPGRFGAWIRSCDHFALLAIKAYDRGVKLRERKVSVAPLGRPSSLSIEDQIKECELKIKKLQARITILRAQLIDTSMPVPE